MITPLSGAVPCSLAAMLAGVPNTSRRSMPGSPVRLPTTTKPVLMPMRTPSRTGPISEVANSCLRIAAVIASPASAAFSGSSACACGSPK